MWRFVDCKLWHGGYLSEMMIFAYPYDLCIRNYGPVTRVIFQGCLTTFIFPLY
jgi:hypothetical protein